MVLGNLLRNAETAKKILVEAVRDIPVAPGCSCHDALRNAILTSKPYPVRAAVMFGTDPLLGHGAPLRGKAALEALDFYVHVDTTLNPSAHFADLILPATTCWEREALLPFCEIAEDTMNWAQLRPAATGRRRAPNRRD